MIKQNMKRAAFIAIAGAVALGAATPSWATPASSSMSAIENAAPSMVTDVRYRGHRARHHRSNGVNGAGVALGILGAAAAMAGAAAYGQQDYYGGPGYYQQDNPGYYYPQGNPGYYRQDYNGSNQY